MVIAFHRDSWVTTVADSTRYTRCVYNDVESSTCGFIFRYIIQLVTTFGLCRYGAGSSSFTSIWYLLNIMLLECYAHTRPSTSIKAILRLQNLCRNIKPLSINNWGCENYTWDNSCSRGFTYLFVTIKPYIKLLEFNILLFLTREILAIVALDTQTNDSPHI